MSDNSVSTARAVDCLENPPGRLLEGSWFRTRAVPNSSWAAIYRRDNYRCVYCECDLTESGETKATIDHLIPKCVLHSRAIANQDLNRVACCLRCNQNKGSWFPRRWTHRGWFDREYLVGLLAFFLRPGKPLPVPSRRTKQPA